MFYGCQAASLFMSSPGQVSLSFSLKGWISAGRVTAVENEEMEDFPPPNLKQIPSTLCSRVPDHLVQK